jgi:hypothetical protein
MNWQELGVAVLGGLLIGLAFGFPRHRIWLLIAGLLAVALCVGVVLEWVNF